MPAVTIRLAGTPWRTHRPPPQAPSRMCVRLERRVPVTADRRLCHDASLALVQCLLDRRRSAGSRPGLGPVRSPAQGSARRQEPATLKMRGP